MTDKEIWAKNYEGCVLREFSDDLGFFCFIKKKKGKIHPQCNGGDCDCPMIEIWRTETENENTIYQKLDSGFVKVGTLKRIMVKRSYNPESLSENEQRAANYYYMQRLAYDLESEIKKYTKEIEPYTDDNSDIIFGLTVLVVVEDSNE